MSTVYLPLVVVNWFACAYISESSSPKEIVSMLVRTLALAAAMTSPVAFAQAFDWTMLQGQWAESAKNQFGCRKDNVHHRFEVSADRKSLTFKFDRKWEIRTGKEVEQYSAAIKKAETNMLVISYGSELGEMPADTKEWELRFIGPGTYRWRLMSWPEGQYNNVIGVRCGA